MTDRIKPTAAELRTAQRAEDDARRRVHELQDALKAAQLAARKARSAERETRRAEREACRAQLDSAQRDLYLARARRAGVEQGRPHATPEQLEIVARIHAAHLRDKEAMMRRGK